MRPETEIELAASALMSHRKTTTTNQRDIPPLQPSQEVCVQPAAVPATTSTSTAVPIMDDQTLIEPPKHLITVINDNDVLCGRGGETNHHLGNVRFRTLVKQYQLEYLRARRSEKPKISTVIVQKIRSLGGRFLKRSAPQENGDAVWRDVGNKKAREKTSQALRENAPEIRSATSNGSGVTVNVKRKSKATSKKAKNGASNGSDNGKVVVGSTTEEEYQQPTWSAPSAADFVPWNATEQSQLGNSGLSSLRAVSDSTLSSGEEQEDDEPYVESEAFASVPPYIAYQSPAGLQTGLFGIQTPVFTDDSHGPPLSSCKKRDRDECDASPALSAGNGTPRGPRLQLLKRRSSNS
eukprot:CAMPEP_0196821304 /NCGR_PEP_ID=MMETSP1362-20130617/78693_1 /TAXON_ID=163516 /ORGANISM="Leptocylindrus danicus, Strain CCMP1856" /LENGTH=350 /DNA_ID=CAMNT_0042200455 /DNA_START=167 /DNA_END=1219 /DNA_ORIENTATION=-